MMYDLHLLQKRLTSSAPKLASHSHLQNYMPAAVEAAFG